MGQPNSERPNSEKPKCPEEDAANVVSKVLFSYATPVFTLAFKRRRAATKLAKQQQSGNHTEVLPQLSKEDLAKAERALRGELEEEDFWLLSTSDQLEQVAKLFQLSYSQYESKPKDSPTKRLSVAIYYTTKYSLVLSGAVKLVNTGLQFSYPFFLRYLLLTLQPNSPEPIEDAYYWSLGLGLAMFAKALTENTYFWYAAKSGWRARSALSNAVYRKSLRLSLASRQSKTLGEIVNLMQLDASKIEACFLTLHTTWDGVLQIVGYTMILYWIIDWAAFVGLAFMVTLIPIQGRVMKSLIANDRKAVKITDERVKVVNEAIQGVMGVKMSSWEDSLSAKIESIRQREVALLRQSIGLKAFSSAYMMSTPAMTAVVAIAVYASVLGGVINPSVMFSALNTFSQLRFPLMLYPAALAQIASAMVSRKRLAEFLAMEEVSFPCEEREVAMEGEEDADLVLKLDKATVFWSDPAKPAAPANAPSATVSVTTEMKPTPALRDVSLSIKRGDLVAIVGSVGQGKTALVNTMLREMFLESGSLTMYRKQGTSPSYISFAGQMPWIVNASVRDNILFGSEMDREWYDEVITACQLLTDLESFADGDETEIGERGVSLSGGQKQRVAIARAAYKSRESHMVILDDPLSALDPAVANLLFEECLLGLLGDQTRVVVTNNLDVLQHCDMIVVVDKNDNVGGGQITEQGTYQSLMGDPKSTFAQLMTRHRGPEAGGEGKDKPKRTKSAQQLSTRSVTDNNKQQQPTVMIKAEERAKGAVAGSLYLAYIRAGGGLVLFAVLFCIFLLSLGFSWLNTYWITLWTSAVDFTNGSYTENSLTFYLVGFALTAVFMALSTFLRTVLLMVMAANATTQLHKQLLTSVLHAPTRFFDQTPTGRILQRFSYDIRVLDYETGEQAGMFMFSAMFVLLSVGTMIGVTPIFAAFVVPMIGLYFVMLQFYRPVMRDAKRLGSIATSPVYSSLSETLGGVATVRAFRAQDQFLQSNLLAVNRMIRMVMTVKLCERWLGVRLEMMGSAIALVAAMLCVQAVIAGTITAGLAGLSLSYAMNTTGLLSVTVRSFTMFEASMNSVERVRFMGNYIDQEKWREEDYDNEDEEKGGGKVVPPLDWPQRGEIEVTDLSVRYRDDTPLILRSISFHIAAGEKIGIAGRTGSGKSSLFLALMRIVEPQPGSVVKIDGLDVSRMTLFQLRSKIAIAPQLSVLFSGTLRYNLDPFSRYGDLEVWQALEKVGLAESIKTNLIQGLESKVSEYGENFSQGERQLISLCRAVLAKPTVLMLDEASASLDMNTDELIQRTIREQFSTATLLVIAHRLDTIARSDRIMVLGAGSILEFASPKELLQNPNSELSLAVQEMSSGSKFQDV
ncbi:hypothetical protein BASA81_000484 [Batrachochytrium salamandrivorans]|nr:hypothetical protein BASA81_000484 [Batrachochytrium salamandrivorans]